MRTVLVEWLHVAEVWVGANFLFGHDRSGNFSLLRSLGARYGFRAEKIDPVRYKDFVVSSTRVRRLIVEGRVDEAGALLGHHYAHRRHRRAGAEAGPRAGVSDGEPVRRERARAAGRRLCDDRDHRRRRLSVDHEHRHAADVRKRRGRTSSRPMCSTSTRTCTASKLRLGFVQRLRDEKKFDGVDALKAQIEADRARAQDLFDRMGL